MAGLAFFKTATHIDQLLPLSRNAFTTKVASNRCAHLVIPVGENQRETILINCEENASYSLPHGSILARKSYLRTLTDPAEILPELALTNNKRWSKLELQAPIKLVDGRPWSPRVYRALRLLGNMLEVA
jgi:hypothetical protein